MSPPTVVYDACVLYPAPLRDLLMHLALTGLFRAKWTDAIHDEWIKSVLSNRPDLKREQLERTRELMNRNVVDALVEGYESIIETLSLPDPNDRHVLAAAIHAEAKSIVTFNLSDFPTSILARWGIEAMHPDKFVSRLLEAEFASVCNAVRLQRKNLRRPPVTAEELLKTFESQGLSSTVVRLRDFISSI